MKRIEWRFTEALLLVVISLIIGIGFFSVTAAEFYQQGSPPDLAWQRTSIPVLTIVLVFFILHVILSIKKVTPFFLALLFFSCASRKDVVYYQNIDDAASSEKTNSYEIKIQPDDLLMVPNSTLEMYSSQPPLAEQ